VNEFSERPVSVRRERPPWWIVALAGTALLLDKLRPTEPLRGAIALPSVRGPTPEREDRGRSASTPADIPAKGWKDILWRVYGNISEHRVVSIAAGVTFFVLLAIFPGIAALVAIYGLMADPSAISQHLNDLSTVMPGGATEIIGDQLQRLTSQPSSKLGFALLFGVAVSLWSANAGTKALFDALNVVYGEKERRSFIRLNLITLAFTLGAMLLLVLALSAIAVLPMLLGDLGLSSATEWLIAIGKWPVLLIFVATAISLVYRDGPSREKPKWRWVTWGSAFAGVAWLVMSILFSWYASHFGSYNKTYGSLGAAIGFMTWMWLSFVMILLGAELDPEMEHQTACDTTGAPQPLGQRGARVADTVGRASPGWGLWGEVGSTDLAAPALDANLELGPNRFSLALECWDGWRGNERPALRWGSPDDPTFSPGGGPRRASRC
jgi:membrane protein